MGWENRIAVIAGCLALAPAAGAVTEAGAEGPPVVGSRTVSSPTELVALLRAEPPYSGRVVVPKDVTWNLTGFQDIPLRSGVQLVGERGDLASRPTLYTDAKQAADGSDYTLFTVLGNDVRVEGLHLRGPKPAADHPNTTPYVHAITVLENSDLQPTGRNVVIADNEMDLWSGAAAYLIDPHGNAVLEDWKLPEHNSWKHLEPGDAKLVSVERNYLHHNVMNNGGYGVSVSGGAYGTVTGNVFDTNRHAVAGSGRAFSGYVARFNYVLEGGYTQDGSYNQHFDMHGSTPTGDNKGYGGQAGDYVEIAYNTIRGEQGYSCLVVGCLKTRPAFMLRGRPTQGAFFHDNVLVHDDQDSAIALKMSKGATGLDEDNGEFNFHAAGNHYDTDYTREIAAGDFDGDRRTDVFLATGTGWFLSRAGIRPWEFLRASDKRTGQLGFADIDNDGITDVLYRDGAGKVGYVKSGGGGPLEPLTTSPVLTADMRFGDFDGDGKTDIFYTRNQQWRIWRGSTHTWTDAGTSSSPIGELIFGEFDGVKGTDVAAVKKAGWMFSSAGTARYAKLNARLRDSFASGVTGDFNGNGRTDIAFGSGTTWLVSYDGRGPLATLRKGNSAPPLKSLLVGRFDNGRHGAQVVGFDARGLSLSGWTGQGTDNAFAGRSTQKMR